MTNLFVIENSSGEAHAVASVRDAAVMILGDDGHDFEIRADEDGDGFSMWQSRLGGGGRKGGMVRLLLGSAAPTEAEAEAEIYAEVVRQSERYGFTVLTEVEYEQVQREIDAE